MPQQISFFDVQPIWQHLVAGKLILTPNQRLASRIQSAYAIACHEQGQLVVDSPAVYSFNQWVDRCWQRLLINANSLAMHHKTLSASQEQAVWERVVSSSHLGAALLRPSATAQQAASAYRTLINWKQCPSDQHLRTLFKGDEDAAVLLGWIDQFESLCDNSHWLPSVRIAEKIHAAFEQGVLPSIGDVLLIGFEDMPPLHQSLLDTAGIAEHVTLNRKPAAVDVVACESTQQEWLAAAVWAKQILKNDINARVAIVVPDLAQQRQSLERVLLSVFDPAHNQVTSAEGEAIARRNLPFNVSAGYPLIEAPVINAALNALSLAFDSVDVATLEALCQSPFYCNKDVDLDSLSRLITQVRAQKTFELSAATFRNMAIDISEKSHVHNEAADDLGWQFATKLIEIGTLTRSSRISKVRPFAQWLVLFQSILKTVGWPGSRVLDSIEHQQVSQWQQAISDFTALDFVLPPMSFGESLSQFRSILSRQIFQPQTADSSLQILGTLEAAGLQFSHLWLQSMSEQQWPPTPSPNPLLPFSFQRQQRMPHASAERELEYAQNLTQRFIHSSDFVVVSSPLSIDDNPAATSSLFAAYPQLKLEQLLSRDIDSLVPLIEIRRRHYESQSIEWFEPGDAPQVQKNEKIRGGSSLFSSQSACPFRAFANHRLSLKALAEPELGLNAADRGSLLHRALELLWQKLKTQQALLALDESGQSTLCEETARYSVDEIAQRKPSRLGSRYKQLESLRLKKLLHAWLEVEKGRANFKVVGIESRKVFQFSVLELETRIDRVDQLDDGSLLVIDYKTGLTSVNRWWGDRPDEPQLPLYSMLTDNEDDEVGGVMFAQVRSDGCSIKGVGAEELQENSIQFKDKYKTDAGVTGWSQLKQHWEKVLTALAEDFISGKAQVDPKQPAQTCQYCDLASICRINHQLIESHRVER
jgi:probable DNA repair protein